MQGNWLNNYYQELHGTVLRDRQNGPQSKVTNIRHPNINTEANLVFLVPKAAIQTIQGVSYPKTCGK